MPAMDGLPAVIISLMGLNRRCWCRGGGVGDAGGGGSGGSSGGDGGGDDDSAGLASRPRGCRGGRGGRVVVVVLR